MAYCEKCGAELPQNSKFCLNCGNKVEEIEQPQGEVAVAEAVEEKTLTYGELFEEWKGHSPFSRFIMGNGYAVLKVIKRILDFFVGFSFLLIIIISSFNAGLLKIELLIFAIVSVFSSTLDGFLKNVLHVLLLFDESNWFKEKGYKVSEINKALKTFPKDQKEQKKGFFSLKFEMTRSYFLSGFFYSKKQSFLIPVLLNGIFLVCLSSICSLSFYFLFINFIEEFAKGMVMIPNGFEEFANIWAVLKPLLIELLEKPLFYIVIVSLILINSDISTNIVAKIVGKKAGKIIGKIIKAEKEAEQQGQKESENIATQTE